MPLGFQQGVYFIRHRMVMHKIQSAELRGSVVNFIPGSLDLGFL